ncbi:Tricalbin-3 [Candida viswanathii]|uniref:Tricalbin-3 n=1 Tax=Candida viswanathii TaxID=5486 RepID=A0A367Y513_9ASCO|nr:Tricalbin-3 [Candida viswanathii]
MSSSSQSEEQRRDDGPQRPIPGKEDIDKFNKKVGGDINNKTPSTNGPNNHPRPPKQAPPEAPKQAHSKRIRDNTTFSWKNVGGWDIKDTSDKKALLHNTKQVESYIIDHFYGDWYWNCSLMIGTCFFAWLLAKIGGGFLSLGVVLLFTNSVYRGEMRRFNRNIRDDLARAKADDRLVNELETMEWMNSFLDKFWVIYMPAFSETVMFQTNEILKDQAPGFGIEKLTLDEFTLGSKAPRVNAIKSYSKTRQDVIEMDWAFSFAPNDTDDMTKNEIKRKIDPKVALGVTIGKGFVTKTLPILVENMSFTGRMKIKLRLSQNFPHVKMVSVQFLEPPDIDYALKPVGGDTFGIDIMSFIPGLSKFVNGMIHSTLRPMFYAPNSFDVDVEELMAAQSNDSIGVVEVTVKRCRKLKTGTTTKAKSLNPYVQVKVSNNPKIDERTKTKRLVNDPVFMEIKTILINQLEGNFLNFNVYNLIEDQMDDQLIGNCEFGLGELMQQENITGLTKNIMEGGKVVGKIELDIKYFPTMQPTTLEDGTKEINTDTEVGIMKLTLHEACDLDISNSAIGLLNPYAEIFVNNEEVKKCRKLRQTNEPSWNESFESLIFQQSDTSIQVLVRDSVDDSIVANLEVNLQDVIFETKRGQQWFTCPTISKDGPAPRIRLTAGWKPLVIDEALSSKIVINAPIGGMRLHLRGAKGLKNLESVGYVDPYVRVLLNGKLRAKTTTFAETVNPEWDSVYFLPVANEHQHYLLQIMDAEPEGKDRSLGTAAVNVADFLRKNDEGYYLGYDGSNEVIEQPVLFNTEPVGAIFYSVSFYPTIPIYSLSQLHNKVEYFKQLEENEEREKEKYERDEQLYKENPDEFEWVEIKDHHIREPPKIELKLEDAVKYRAGAMAVHLLHGEFEKPDVFVHTLFDEHAFPSGVSPRSEGKRLNTSSIGETFIRDLPNSNLVFRIASVVEVTDESQVYAEKMYNTLEIYEKSFGKPIRLNLGNRNYIEVQLEYVPSPVKLAPLDTILDVGKIKLEIIGAENLKAVDSNGKSDPICVVQVDGVKVFKTDKKRKTLDPTWNETAEFPMISRSRQILLVEVYDWDLTHADELLGVANLDISNVPPLQTTPFTVNLDTQGTVNLRVTFFPEYIRPPLNCNSVLPVNMDAITETSWNAINGVAGAASDGVGSVGEHLGKGHGLLKSFKSRRSRKSHEGGEEASTLSPSKSSTGGDSKAESEIPEDEKEFRKEQGNEIESVDAMPNIREHNLPPPQSPFIAQEGGHPASPQGNGGSPKKGHFRNLSAATGNTDVASSFAPSINGADAIPGRLTIVEARNVPAGENLDVKAVLKTSSKEKSLIKTRSTKFDKNSDSYKWSESVPFKSTAAGTIILVLREKHTFGKSVVLGETALELSNYVNVSENVTVNIGSAELVVNIKYFQ